MKLSISAFYLVLISMLAYSACTKPASSNQIIDPALGSQGQSMDPQDAELLKQVEEFVGGQPKSRQEGWSWLENQPRNKLIEALSRLQRNTPRDDPRYLEIAFVLCNFDYNYQTNRQSLLSALTRNRTKDIPADLVVELIIRLVQRGDKTLLHSLFVATDWADGAMSDDLSRFFIDEMVNNPTDLLVKLTLEPKPIRYKVYSLIVSETTVTANDIMKMEAYLTTVGPDSKVYPTAKEILKMLSSYRGGRKVVSKFS